jgi:hypothetical protein
MRRPLLLAAAAALVAAAPASAENRVIPAFDGESPPLVLGQDIAPVLDGPFLSGEDVIWLERRQGLLAIVADGPRGQRDLDTSTNEPGPEPLQFDLDVAEGRLALSSFHYTCRGDVNCSRYNAGTPDNFTTLLGPVDGPFRQLDTSCGIATADVAAMAFAGVCLISGGRELHEEGDAPPRRLDGSTFMPPQVAGDFIAEPIPGANAQWVGVRVRRRLALDEVYRVDVAITDFDLLPDGSVAYALRGTPEVGWSSPEFPTIHRRNAGYEVRDVVADGNDIGARSDGGRIDIIHRADDSLSLPVIDPAAIGSFDLHGSRVAWARRPCSRISIVVWDRSQPQPELGGTDCTLPDHGSGPLRVGAGRRVAVTITCPQDAAAGCAGVTSLSAYLRRRRGGRRFLRGSSAESFDLLAGESDTIRVRLRRRGLRRFRTGYVQIETTLRRNRQDQRTRRALRLR